MLFISLHYFSRYLLIVFLLQTDITVLSMMFVFNGDYRKKAYYHACTYAYRCA